MTTATPVSPSEAVLTEALTGLTAQPQKTLSPWLFYDQRGSDLFEQITELPEYYLTRTERALFAHHSDDILREFLSPGAPAPTHPSTGYPPDPFTIAELGAGTASKTGLLLQAAARIQPNILYQPIDVSPSALDAADETLTAAIPGLTIHPRVANYVTEPYTLAHPNQLHPPVHPFADRFEPGSPAGSRGPLGHKPRTRVLALYIGSSIGNFSPEQARNILRRLRSHLQPGDALLLGADLAPSSQKPISTILSAYDDAAGVTAAFNLNILVRLNRELDANFNLDAFAHRARWNAAQSRIEMHLESLIPQTVHIPVAESASARSFATRPVAAYASPSGTETIHFAQGETIHTENSYKFTTEALQTLLTRTGFTPTRTFQDPPNTFALTLAHTL